MGNTELPSAQKDSKAMTANDSKAMTKDSKARSKNWLVWVLAQVRASTT